MSREVILSYAHLKWFIVSNQSYKLFPPLKIQLKKYVTGLDATSRAYFKIAMAAIENATENCIQFIEDVKATRRTGVIILRKTIRKQQIDGTVVYDGICYSECLGQCKDKAQVLK